MSKHKKHERHKELDRRRKRRKERVTAPGAVRMAAAEGEGSGSMVAAEVPFAAMESSPVNSSAGNTRNVPPPANAFAVPPINAVESNNTQFVSDKSAKLPIVTR